MDALVLGGFSGSTGITPQWSQFTAPAVAMEESLLLATVATRAEASVA
jgi:hypothetical protein